VWGHRKRINTSSVINALLISAGLSLFFTTMGLTGYFIGMVVRAIVR
jgi:cytochrome c biogenesis protein CcdA